MEKALFEDLVAQRNYNMIFFIYYSENNQINQFSFDMKTFITYFNLYISSFGVSTSSVITKLLQHIKNNLK